MPAPTPGRDLITSVPCCPAQRDAHPPRSGCEGPLTAQLVELPRRGTGIDREWAVRPQNVGPSVWSATSEPASGRASSSGATRSWVAPARVSVTAIAHAPVLADHLGNR
jgi:hypothetical protein